MISQEDILLSLIQTGAGQDFASEKTGWTRGTDVCSWFGVQCNDSGDVTSISLTGYALYATLPSDLSELRNLQDLILSNCELSGQIPPELAEMTSLRKVDLSLNQLTGSLPHFTSSDLTILSLAHNKLSGAMPAIGTKALHRLVTIDLKNNQLYGGIPSFSVSLPSLKHLDLSQNQLGGRFLSNMNMPQMMPSLERLYLSENNLSGTIPAALSDSLQEFHCQHNQLTGTIPAALATLADLQVLLVHNNRLTGEIPREICDLNLNSEYFALDNRDSGGYTRQRRRDELWDERDGCSSVACPAGFSSEAGVYPCLPCEDPAMNPYLGATQCSEYTQDEILDIFFEATNGDRWTDQSWSSDDIEICSRTGITCDSDGIVVGISLRNQGLSGTIPLELGFLPNLAELDISQNEIRGNIPEELSLAPLQTLTLAENYLSGYVPDALCRKVGVNGNGRDGFFGCDFVACRMGTFHPEGHATPGQPCQNCPMVDAIVLANIDCGAHSFKSTVKLTTAKGIQDGGIIAVVSVVGGLLILFGWWILRKVEAAPRLQRVQQCDAGAMKDAKMNKEMAVVEVDLKSSRRSSGSLRSFA